MRFPAKPFFANVDEGIWVPEAHPDAEGRIEVGRNAALVKTASERVLVDTGYGDDTHNGCTGWLGEDLARTGFDARQVSVVVNTHAHGDHMKGNTKVVAGRRSAAFPAAQYLLARADWNAFGGSRRAPEFDEQLASLHSQGTLALVEPGLRISPEIMLLPSPGHTPGHTSVLIESRGRCALVLGDVCHHPLHFAHPHWVSEYDTDPELTPRTRRDLLNWAAARDAWVICAHARAPGLGRVQRCADGFRWCPAQ